MMPHEGQRVATAGAPLDNCRAAMIMVHGRGAAPENILELAPHFGRRDVAYIAPAASGGTWYPKGFMSPIADNEPGISSGIAVIDALVHDLLAHGLPSERLIVLGFSQGGCLASTYAVRHPRRFGGVIVYSGGLIGPPGTMWLTDPAGPTERHAGHGDPSALHATPVFLGCSDVDGHIPRTRVDESAGVFRALGADVTERIYPGMGHLVNEDEIAFTRDLLAKVVASH